MFCGVKSMFSSSSSSSSSASFSTISFNVSCYPYPIFSIILLYNKEVASHTLCSHSASASRVAATVLIQHYNFVKWFFIQLVMFIYRFSREISSNFMVISSAISYHTIKKENDYLIPPVKIYGQSVFLMTLVFIYVVF